MWGVTVWIQYGSAFSCTHFKPVKDMARGSDLWVLSSRRYRRTSSEAHVLLRTLAQRAVTASVLSLGLWIFVENKHGAQTVLSNPKLSELQAPLGVSWF